MWDILGLLGLAVVLVAVFWLVASALLRGPRKWAAWLAVSGLILFFVSTMIPSSRKGDVVAPQVPGTPAATNTAAVLTPHRVASRPQCSQPHSFAGDSSSEFLDGDVRYSLMQTASYANIRPDGGSQTIWAFIGMRNESARAVEINPWFDFWLMPLPLGVDMPYPPQPLRVDVLEIGGPAPLLDHRSLLLEPGMSCLLQVTFQLPPQALRAVLNIGYVQAFTIDLEVTKGKGP